MKNLYVILVIALAFFSDADAQCISAQPKTNLVVKPNVAQTPDHNNSNSDRNHSRSEDFTNQSGDNSIILNDYSILWVFNDVGNHNTHRDGNSTDAIAETESLNSSLVKTSLYPLPAKDHLNFSLSADINSGMIVIYDAAGKIILTQNFAGTEAMISSSDFIPGIYFYQVIAENKPVSSGKFMKN